MKILFIVLIFVLFLFFIRMSNEERLTSKKTTNEEVWAGFVYPDIKNIPTARNAQNYIIGNFQSFEECQRKTISMVRNRYQETGEQGDYLCGLNCTHRAQYDDLLICQSTRK